MPVTRPALRLVILGPAVGLLVIGTTLLGPTWLPVREIIAGASGSHDAPLSPAAVFWRLRLPRTLLAAGVGAGLAVGGVVCQAVFRNPLAEPYTLGIASGASLAASIGMLAGYGRMLLGGVPALSWLAFGGALGVIGLVYLVSRGRAVRDTSRLLLAGVCVAYMCSAGILLVFFLATRTITSDIVTWMMGSLGILRPRAALEVWAVVVPVTLLLATQHRALDLLHFGQTLAASRGVGVGRTTWISLGLVSLMTAVIVANCGPIGFVGLMVPHIGRAICGVRTLPLLAGSALVGAGFLAVCDGLARSLPTVELPVGVVTNVLGAVFFFYLLATRDIDETRPH